MATDPDFAVGGSEGSDRPESAADRPAGPDGIPDGRDPDPRDAARDALQRARKVARDKGFRPGMKPSKRRRPATQATASGPGKDGRDPALVGEELDRLLADRGWVADVTVGSVVGRWEQIVGPDIAAHVQPSSFEGSVLTVAAESTAWATQMRLLTSMVLGRIEAEVGAGVVTELVVKGPHAPSWVKGKLRVKGQGPRDTYG